MNKNLVQYELTRFHWQVLNTVYVKEVTKGTILVLLRHFLDDTRLSSILNYLTREKNTASGLTMIQITEEGKEAFTNISAMQHRTRMQLFQGITNDEYETTIKTLKRVVDNDAD